LFKIPVVGTYHTLFAIATGYLSPRQIFREHRFNLINKRSNLTERIAWALLSYFYNQCSIITTPTKIIGDTIKKHGIMKPVYTVPNGLDVTQFPGKEVFVKRNR